MNLLVKYVVMHCLNAAQSVTVYLVLYLYTRHNRINVYT